DRDVQLLHDRIALREELGREVKSECRIGVKIIPFDEISQRPDEDRLQPVAHVRDVDTAGGLNLRAHVGVSLRWIVAKQRCRDTKATYSLESETGLAVRSSSTSTRMFSE